MHPRALLVPPHLHVVVRAEEMLETVLESRQRVHAGVVICISAVDPPDADFVVLVGGDQEGVVAGDDDGFYSAAGGRDYYRLVVVVVGVAGPGEDLAVGGAAVEVFSGEGEGEDGGGVAFEGCDEVVVGGWN